MMQLQELILEKRTTIKNIKNTMSAALQEIGYAIFVNGVNQFQNDELELEQGQKVVIIPQISGG